MIGLITKIISDTYTVKYDKKVVLCKARGKFRNEKKSPLVGDYVVIDLDKQMIMEIKPRKNELVRPPISNIDQALIITSAKQPNFDSNLLDKLIIIMEYYCIKPIICFTKLDLLKGKEKKEINYYIRYYRRIGYTVLTNRQYFGLKRILKNKITALVGQSGVGKSSLLNFLNKQLNLPTNEISMSLGRGKHTTRHVELIELCNGYVADTPGFSSLDFMGMTKVDIRDNIIEFNKYKDKCQYADCFHLNEDNCQVKKSVNKGIILKTRYDNYQKFINRSDNRG